MGNRYLHKQTHKAVIIFDGDWISLVGHLEKVGLAFEEIPPGVAGSSPVLVISPSSKDTEK